MEELTSFWRSRQPVNLLIVAANIIVFIIFTFIGNTENAMFMVDHGASFAPYIIYNGEYYRLFTCMFLHFTVEHLAYNMLLLFYMGDSLEHQLGRVRYLLIYMLGGLAGNILSVWIDMRTESFSVSAGASGAIFAVVGAMLWIVIRNRGKVEGYSLKRMIVMIVLSVMEGFVVGNVDNSAHIGGLITGFVLAIIMYRRKKQRKIKFSAEE